MSYIGNQPVYQAFVTDQFSGNGSTTAFTMSVAPANTASVLVAVSGVLQDPSTYSVSGTTLTFSAAPPSGTGNISALTNGFTIGYLDIPQNATNSNYVLTLADRGKHIYSTASGAQIVYIPTNANVAFPVGTAVNFVLQGAGNITITANSGVTMFLAGNSTSTTSRLLGSYGVATVQKVATNTWFLVGVGVT